MKNDIASVDLEGVCWSTGDGADGSWCGRDGRVPSFTKIGLHAIMPDCSKVTVSDYIKGVLEQIICPFQHLRSNGR
jgi:hypothetical protein